MQQERKLFGIPIFKKKDKVKSFAPPVNEDGAVTIEPSVGGSYGHYLDLSGSTKNVQEIVNILMNKVVDLRFINTICFPTKRNQEQIKELSEKCDVMFVIGSFTSANSKRLTDLSKERNKRSYQVTCALDINEKWLEDCNVVGISAGASTPDNIIEEVLERIKEIGNVQEEEIYA